MGELEAFTFNAETHEYALAGESIPGCTKILSSGGLVSFDHVAADVLEKKSELGREVHRACHLWNLGTLRSCDDRVRPYLNAWILFLEKTKFKPLLSEFQTVGYVNGMPFGMQIDSQGMIGKEDTIVELKIGEILPHHGIQLAGYAAGLPHKTLATALARFMMRKRIAVQLRENSVPKIHRFEERSDFDVFASVLYVAHWKQQFTSVYERERKVL